MEIGEHIDNYIITEVMHGGMSDLYRAVDENSSRVVIKRLKEEADEEHRKLFLREIRIIESLKHHNIIEVLKSNCEDYVIPYYVMPPCGKTLVDVSVSDDEIYKTELCMQMCEGIAYMHEKGVYHRDIKPQNILVKNDVVKVADFGLSRFDNRDTTTLTATSEVAGTTWYRPPEYENGYFKDGTVASDIYMLGKTMYFLFSKGCDVSNMRSNSVSAYIWGIVERATRESPQDRYSSVKEIQDELVRYKNALLQIQNAPKTIDEIRQSYTAGSPAFNEEQFKHFMALPNESTQWGDSIDRLSDKELNDFIHYKQNKLNILINNFVDSIAHATDYIQFEDIDSFVRFAGVLITYNHDVALNQQLLRYLIKLSIANNRWPSMQGLAIILNSLIKKDVEHYRIFVITHKSELLEMKPKLRSDSEFCNEIESLIP